MSRPSRIASQLLISLLEDAQRRHGAIRRPSLLVVGVGFKPGQSDLSNSPGLQLLNYMRQSGEVDLTFCDPLVNQEAVPEVPKLEDSSWRPDVLKTFDAIMVAAKQPGLDYNVLDTLEDVRIDIWNR